MKLTPSACADAGRVMNAAVPAATMVLKLRRVSFAIGSLPWFFRVIQHPGSLSNEALVEDRSSPPQ
jgi:hypothetical protein